MKTLLLTTLTIILTMAASPTNAEQVTEITQYGITWTFDKPVTAGQFITGDWWVLGPVTVTNVTPTPGPDDPDNLIETPLGNWGDTSLRNDQRMRNGSMIALKATQRHGYDSRNQTYDPELSIKFPLTIENNRSLISTISNKTTPVPNFVHHIMWDSEKSCQNVLKTAAVLTVLAEAPPQDAFRPCYTGTEKTIYRAADLKWELLLNLEAPRDPYPGWKQMERYFQRPWIENMCNWTQQSLNPNENQTNYGREASRVVSIASLMLHLDVPKQQKEKLLIGLVQYGIDISGTAKVGGNWNWGGGHSSGRKWPVIFASLMLDAPELRDLPETCVFHEDAQTYYGTGWFGQTALYWMIQHHGNREHYEHLPPEKWAKWNRHTEGYRVCCNAVAWIGTALSARLMGAIEVWNHDAYFDYCDRWMRLDDPYAANRGKHKRPSAETTTLDPFVTDMWRHHRDSAPEQNMAGNPRMFVWTGKGKEYKWVPNPKPTAEEVEAHLKEVKQMQ